MLSELALAAEAAGYLSKIHGAMPAVNYLGKLAKQGVNTVARYTMSRKRPLPQIQR